jgi:hypothetical protein
MPQEVFFGGRSRMSNPPSAFPQPSLCRARRVRIRTRRVIRGWDCRKRSPARASERQPQARSSPSLDASWRASNRGNGRLTLPPALTVSALTSVRGTNANRGGTKTRRRRPLPSALLRRSREGPSSCRLGGNPFPPDHPTLKPAMETIGTVENNRARFPRVPTVFHSPYD